MASVTAAEAESRFHEILERVSHGEEIVVTRDDKPIARVVPEKPRNLDSVRRAVQHLQVLQQEMRDRGSVPLTDEEILSAIREGRK